MSWISLILAYLATDMCISEFLYYNYLSPIQTNTTRLLCPPPVCVPLLVLQGLCPYGLSCLTPLGPPPFLNAGYVLPAERLIVQVIPGIIAFFYVRAVMSCHYPPKLVLIPSYHGS